jgi:hypothetical protein
VILACRVLFPFLLLWMALLKLPRLFLAPEVMVSWEALLRQSSLEEAFRVKRFSKTSHGG